MLNIPALGRRFDKINNTLYRAVQAAEMQEVSLTFENTEDTLWLHFSDGDITKSISFPVPYRDGNDNYVIGTRVVRAVGTWYLQGKEMAYWNLMDFIMLGRIDSVFPITSKRCQLERLVRSFYDGNASHVFKGAQTLISGIVNNLPLTKTPLETWAKCNQVVFLDKEYNMGQVMPEVAQEIQHTLNEKFFPWTSLGLSDSAMTKPYLLKQDLRVLTPFGVKHHNVQRNLYQTLGMRGDEAPSIITRSASKLLNERTLSRSGWNWMTAFVDLPVTFEDQLVVDIRHLDKFTCDKKQFICFGSVKIDKDDPIAEGDLISVEPSGKSIRFFTKSDSAFVDSVDEILLPLNGEKTKASLVTVITKHTFKEGVKFTNCHGNKGIAIFADCGMMFDAGRNNHTPIDIIVSASTIRKRKNYGQALEALTTLLSGNTPVLLPDDIEVNQESLKKALHARGYNTNGTSTITTQWGKLRAICGWVFWGLIKNPENQLWNKSQVVSQDARGLRHAGNKVSHIEFKSLVTIFGKNNPVISEILSHQQGVEDVSELLFALSVLRTKVQGIPVLQWNNIKPINQKGSYFHTTDEMKWTIADESTLPDGFMLKLPAIWQTFIPKDKREAVAFSIVTEEEYMAMSNEHTKDGESIFIDSIYVPNALLRGAWQHDTGLWGLSDIAGYLNVIISACYKFNSREDGDDSLKIALERYFYHISRRLSTKKGEIATRCLSVRYPNSAKATASLRTGLPANTIEIHSSMASDLGVNTGDCVLVERFPCLGFMSLRIQKVMVTDDKQCKYVIRVSGNSLVSQNLDFDGDVLFIMAFHTQAAKEALENEYANPDKTRIGYIEAANAKHIPGTKELSLDDLKLETFPTLTAKKQAEVVCALTGVKRSTGHIVSLAYKVMRIIEASTAIKDKEVNLGIEVILDKVANSVFSKKHAGESLDLECSKALRTADLATMLQLGFPEKASKKLCDIITEEAKKIGIISSLKKGTVINKIIEENHKVYFATRKEMHPIRLLEHLESRSLDLCSDLFVDSQKRSFSRRKLDELSA